MPLGATGWDHATGTWQYPPGVLPQSPRKSARRASVKARRKWEGESSDEEPPPAVAAGAVFIDDGQCWLVYKREAKELPINAEGDVRSMDVVYYYAAKDPKPTERTYLAACEHSGADEVAAWIAATHEKADARARARTAASATTSGVGAENAALAALPPPKLPPPPKRVPALPAEQLLGRAVRVVIADAPSDARAAPSTRSPTASAASRGRTGRAPRSRSPTRRRCSCPWLPCEEDHALRPVLSQTSKVNGVDGVLSRKWSRRSRPGGVGDGMRLLKPAPHANVASVPSTADTADSPSMP